MPYFDGQTNIRFDHITIGHKLLSEKMALVLLAACHWLKTAGRSEAGSHNCTPCNLTIAEL